MGAIEQPPEEGFTRREAILKALAVASRELFVQANWREALATALPQLARSAGVDGAVAVSMHREEGDLVSKREVTWFSEEARRTIPAREGLNWTKNRLTAWFEELQAGKPTTLVRSTAAAQLDSLGANTIQMVPVHVDGVLWGALGFFALDPNRDWATWESEILSTIAPVLGAAIERSAHSKALSETNAKLESALEAGDLSICVLHPAEREIEFDHRISVVLGRPVEVSTVPMTEFEAWIHPDDLFSFQVAMVELFSRSRDRVSVTVRIARADDAYRWIRFTAGAAGVEAAKIGGLVLATVQEVHEQVLAEEKLRRTVDELNDARKKATDAAASVQRELLTKSLPARMGRFSLATISIASGVADGDFFDAFEVDDDTIDVVVGDVMGKGLTAALVGAGFKSQLARTFGLLAARGKVPTAAKLMQAVHDLLGQQLRALDCFATIAYVRIDAAHSRMELIDCGHTRVAIVSPTTGVRFISGAYLPMGVMPGEAYAPIVAEVHPGEVVMLYSDGVLDLEVEGKALEERGLESLLAQVVETEGSLLANIDSTLRGLAAAGSQRDDFTSVLVSIPDAIQAGLIAHREFESKLENIQPVRAQVMQWVAESSHEWTEIDLMQFELATVEVFTNIVRHAHPERGEETVRVDAEDDSKGLEIRFRYAGEPFETAARLDDEPRLSEGGHGLWVIEQSVDRVDTRLDDRGEMWIRLWKGIRSY